MPDPDIHVEDHTEDTPLHLAAMSGHVKICEELVKKDPKILEQGRHSMLLFFEIHLNGLIFHNVVLVGSVKL